ncbi:MAG: M48 family metallopeptidase [Candidatus Acidiferrales bacterium]
MKSLWLRFAGIGLALSFSVCLGAGTASARASSLLQAQPQSRASEAQSTDALAAPGAQVAPATTEKKITAYTLPPDLYRKAHNLGKIAFWGQIVTFVYSVIILLLILKWKLAPKFRDWAERTTSVRFVQTLIFAPLFFFSFDFLSLPPAIARHWVVLKYGLSIQGWGSWLWDRTKGELIGFVIATILVWILYGVMRKSPGRWWFYFWAVSLALGIFLFFLTPVVIDPLFNKFEPLAQKDPALTASLEKMVQRAGQDIPPERMFWMGASAKVTELNAYVTGIGATKRVVVWDNTIAKMTTPQIVFVAGHEMGHYVLNHVWKGVAFFGALLFVFFYVVSRSIGWVLERWGSGWGIRGLDDWASLPAFLLMLMILFFITSPIGSGFSRYLEHQADQYGLEVTHGLTPDSGQIGAQSFQILGEVDLADPGPNPVDIFLFYDHPAIPDRVRYALTYDPWAKGGQPEFVK